MTDSNAHLSELEALFHSGAKQVEKKVSVKEKTLEQAVHSYVLSDHTHLLASVCKSLEIKSYLEDFERYFQDNRQDIYHGRVHTVGVALNAYEGALWMKVPRKEIRAIVLAALYHDARHTLGACSDRINISRAIDALYATQVTIDKKNQVDESVIEYTEQLIRATQFPYSKKPCTDIGALLLRDADVMTLYMRDRAMRLKLFVGLFNEQLQATPTLTIRQAIEQQRKFFNLKEWYTRWGKFKYQLHNWPALAQGLINELERKVVRVGNTFKIIE